MIAKTKQVNWTLIAGALFWLIYLLILMSKAVLAFIDHDEHQFVAAGALMARDGLVPFLDFPYIHSPYFAALLALFFNGHIPLLLSARLLNVLFASALMAILLRYLLRHESLRKWEVLIVLLAPLLFLSTNAFLYTTSRAWNHPPSIFMIVLAFLLLPSLDQRKPLIVMLQALLATGGCLMRLSYAPLGVLFLGLVLWRLRWSKTLLYWFAGVLIAFLPMGYWASLEFEQFLFGLWQYHTVIDPEYFIKTGVLTSEDSVFRDFWSLISKRDTLPLLISFVLVVFSFGLDVAKERRAALSTLWALFFLLLALTAALMKGIVFRQYLALPMIFAFLFMVSYWLHLKGGKRKVMAILLLFASLTALALNHTSFWRVYILSQPEKWTALNMHLRSSDLLHSFNGNDQVFSLSPLFPAEAGVSFEPLLVNGPFLWRTAFIPKESERLKYRMTGEQDISSLFSEHQYKGVMLGHEKALEVKLKKFVQKHYDSVGTFNGIKLYVRRNPVLSDKVKRFSHAAKSEQ